MSKKNNIEIVVILDNIRSMHNIGSIFRTCDAIGVVQIILCGICATPPNKEIHKTALGSTEYVKWQYVSSTCEAVEQLKKESYSIIAMEQTQNSIHLEDYKKKNSKICLIFGNEIKGVSKEVLPMCDLSLEIQQYGVKKSMNVAVAAGISLWAITKK